MNRNIRNYGKMFKKNDNEGARQRRQSPKQSKTNNEFEEILAPRSKRELKGKMLNRCCYVVPDQRSCGQDTETFSQSENYLTEQFGPVLPDLATTAELQKQRTILCESNKNKRPKVENTSQYFGESDPLLNCIGVDCEPWPNVGNAVVEFEELKRDEGTLTQYHNLPKTCRISDTPRVKVIAEKFTKYKKNNIELRRLEEKVVCVEYDIFDDSIKMDETKPVQKMRAFFAIKPITNEKENLLTEMPSKIKKNFNISSNDLNKLKQKEIEIADGTIIENQSYLEDLRKILRRRQNSAKKCNNTINLQTLYEIAKRELLESETDFDLETLTKDEMHEVRNLILENCKSSVHGIRRRTVEPNANISEASRESYISENTISRSLVTELLRVDSH